MALDMDMLENFIRAEAAKRRIDPDQAVRVAKSEGLQPGTWQSNVVNEHGEREQSFGPFQLFRGGLGDEFEKSTGMSLEDPGSVFHQIRFALDKAASGGWGPWHGWKGDQWAGIGGRGEGGGEAKMALRFPYGLHGGATRPDAISGFNPGFSAALQKLYANAPPEVQKELGLTSGYRSIQRQQELWDASDKTGHTVARPGHSKHNSGLAADLYGFGTGGGRVSPETADWVHQNAGNYGLYFPMSYEPWHIQTRGPNTASPAGPVAAAGGAGGDIGSAPPSTEQPGLDTDPTQTVGEKVQSGIARLLGKPLSGEDKGKGLSGLLGELGKAPEVQPMQLQQPGGGGGQQGPALSQYVMQYIASRNPRGGGQGLG